MLIVSELRAIADFVETCNKMQEAMTEAPRKSDIEIGFPGEFSGFPVINADGKEIGIITVGDSTEFEFIPTEQKES